MMHKKYYGFFSNANNNSGVSSSNNNNKTNEADFKIDFPIDMQEKVEECIKSNVDLVDIKEIFEESYNFVCYQLSNTHYDITVKDREILERILYMMNFFEVTEENEVE